MISAGQRNKTMTWKTGDADEFLEDIMTEHVCVWARTLGGSIRCAVCGDSMTQKEELRRLNATERLSAKVARRNAVILRLNADKLSYGEQTQGYADSVDLFAYADILEGKDD